MIAQVTAESTKFPRHFGRPTGLVLGRAIGEQLAIIDQHSLDVMIVGITSVGSNRARASIDATDKYAIERAEVLAEHAPALYDAIRSGAPITPEMMRAYEPSRGGYQ
jgi:sRNA-binding carbon storage regulator CsrA